MKTDGFMLDYGSEGLEDVSAYGTASQSSSSRWSKADDAARALRACDGSFAFHTGVEDAPWWRVDFEQAVLLRYVVVMNRRLPYHRPDQRISVEVTSDGVTWTELVTTLCTFGSDVEGLPLMIDLGETVPVTALRITLVGQGALHFKRILLAGRKRAGESGVVFTVTRSDGLCQRLLALMNAMLLARREGAGFSFEWEEKSYGANERHAVDSVHGLFSGPFVEQHRETGSGAITLKRAPTYSARPHTAEAMTRILDRGAQIGRVRVHQAIDLRDNFPALRQEISDRDYVDIFGQIGFSDSVRRALRAARDLEIGPDDICIHVRGGDIVHGRHAFHGNFVHKALCCYEIDRIVARLKGSGRVFLIGQEQELIDAFARRHDRVVDASTLPMPPGMSHVDAVLFDVTLMSRTAYIHCADSAVAQLAGRIGRAELHEMGGLDGMAGYTPQMARDYAAHGVLGPQIAFSALKAALFHMGAARFDAALDWMEIVSEFRSGNVYDAVLTALLRLRLGDLAGAEEAAIRAVEAQNPHEIGNTLPALLNGRNDGRPNMPAALREDLDARDELPANLAQLRDIWRIDST